jgi:hypothetical protein
MSNSNSASIQFTCPLIDELGSVPSQIMVTAVGIAEKSKLIWYFKANW